MKFKHLIESKQESAIEKLRHLKQQLSIVSKIRLKEEHLKQENLNKALQNQSLRYVEKNTQKLNSIDTQIQASHPNRILKLGFAMVSDADGKLIRSIDQIQEGQTIIQQFIDGKVESTVVKKE